MPQNRNRRPRPRSRGRVRQQQRRASVLLFLRADRRDGHDRVAAWTERALFALETKTAGSRVSHWIEEHAPVVVVVVVAMLVFLRLLQVVVEVLMLVKEVLSVARRLCVHRAAFLASMES